MNYNKLTSEEKKIIVYKWTEPPFTGEYDIFNDDGIYICKRCDAPLFSSKSKFDAGCGWPSFDDGLPNAIKCETASDGIRVKIEYANCNAHLGYEFV